MCFNGFDPEISFSQNFHLKQFPDSRAKREREREREKREPRSRLQLRRSTNPRTDLWPRAFDPPIYEPMNRSSTQSLRLHRRPRAFAPQTHEPISLCVILIFCVILIDPRTDLRFCVILIFYSLSLISVFLLLLWWCGWQCFGGFPVGWWWVLCGWRWKIAFSECYQTHKNIF